MLELGHYYTKKKKKKFYMKFTFNWAPFIFICLI